MAVPDVVRVATYNLWGTGTPERYWRERGIVRGAAPGSPAVALADEAAVWRRRRDLLAGVLLGARPDLVALQEVAGSRAEELAALLSTRGHRMIAAGAGGLAVLTRVDPTHLTVHPLTTVDAGYGGHPGLLEVRTGEFMVWVVHLPVGPDAVKPAIARELRGMALAADGPVLLCGDFNWHTTSPAMVALLAGGPLVDGAGAAGGSLRTMPLPEPRWRLDHVVHRRRDGWRAVGTPTLLGATPDAAGFFPSDHCGLSVTLARLS